MPPRNAGPPSGSPPSRVYTCYACILPKNIFAVKFKFQFHGIPWN